MYGNHTSTCTAHSGATKVHDWMVSVLGPLFSSAGHTVRTQHGVTASAGQRHGNVEIWNYLRDSAGPRSLVFDLSIAHDRFGSSSHVLQNGLLTHPQDLDGPLRVAAQRNTSVDTPARSREKKRGCLGGLALMILKSRMVLAAPGPLLTPPPSSSPAKTPHRSYKPQV